MCSAAPALCCSRFAAVSVAVEADQSAFQRYTGGIVTSGCGIRLDHGVLAPGCNIARGYYLVKNSWDSSWGDAGYLKISTRGNVCGIHLQPSSPTVSGPLQIRASHSERCQHQLRRQRRPASVFCYVVRFGQSEPFGHKKHLASFAHMLHFS